MNAPATHVRVVGLTLSGRERERIRRTIARRLGRHARDIGRVSVRVLDENGPRGGVDVIVRVKVVLRHLPEVIVERRGVRKVTVVDEALRAATLTVRRTLARRRLEKLRIGWQMPAMEEVIAWRPGTPRRPGLARALRSSGRRGRGAASPRNEREDGREGRMT